ncbi:MAG TPA: hypothetical protein VFB38_12550 [Chthonomonadaceae bacterium]|nr:hypothetical protein [Chthonomonadaceae bacterium]
MDFPMRQVLPFLGLIACWGLGGLLMICGFATYLIKYGGRGVMKEMKAGSLPIATFLVRSGTALVMIGCLLGLVE